MDLVRGAQAVQLRGHHGKFLTAEDDHLTVSQDRQSDNRMAIWAVEATENSNRVRLRSCFDSYLTASDIPFLPGMPGKKVIQSRPRKSDYGLEWEVVVLQGSHIHIVLRVSSGSMLCANCNLPPWRNSITHDFCADVNKEWFVWEASIVDHQPSISILGNPTPAPPPFDGRVVFYIIAESDADVRLSNSWNYILFRGRDLEVLTNRIRKEIDLEENITICTRHPSTPKLYPLKLQLPPGNSPIYVVVVKESSILEVDGSLTWNNRQLALAN